MSKESRLDTLTNNAGVMTPPKGSKDAHGHELQIGTNSLGAYLLSEVLLPVLKSTAFSSPPGTVRVTFAASLASYMGPPGGVEFDPNTAAPKDFPDNGKNYAQSKAACVLLASEFAKRYGKDGIISLSWNPGNLTSELQRHMSPIAARVLHLVLLYPTIFGAYTELYAACSSNITEAQNGAFVAPWGRVYDAKADVVAAMKTKEEGGSGGALRFWEWCEKESAAFK